MYDEVFEELIRMECEALAEQDFATDYVSLSPEQQLWLRMLVIQSVCLDGRALSRRNAA